MRLKSTCKPRNGLGLFASLFSSQLSFQLSTSLHWNNINTIIPYLTSPYLTLPYLTLPYGHDDGHGQVYRNGDDNAHNVDRSKKLKFSEEVKIDNPSFQQFAVVCCLQVKGEKGDIGLKGFKGEMGFTVHVSTLRINPNICIPMVITSL